MARVVKVFRALRNHWKKSTLAVCVLSYGGYWLYGCHLCVTSDSVVRREACQLAREFGRQQIAPQERLKKATVILNPAASNGKANNLFEKNAAPILHLAGVEITVVKVSFPALISSLYMLVSPDTDYEGQAKKLMELMEQTDMLIVAGGDGTLQEVITGLLRRPDQEAFSSTPIGFIPLGSHNSLSPSLHFLSDNKVKDITAATLSILKGETVPVDVLQIKGEKEQPVFALIGLRWGAFRDILVPRTPEDERGSLVPHPEEPLKPEEPEKWEEQQLSTPELYIQTLNKNPAERRINDSLMICAEPANKTVGEFISVGNKKVKEPTLFTENSTKLEASVCRLTLPEGAAGFYNIDNEEYEAMPVEVRLLPRKLRFFISAERREELVSQPQ
ncbi:hypothetical protein CCH79_00013022 [Gambusia affinis]|uniref:Acylglycerol kinase, mitochondrial n=1 Tax=Gambusia affinis TaxID=33528 RepID=A0A315WWQ8_GAMAF|nr:hypothetical protein CCH79_00013022 [Gambusia affinis]